ncbi:hypothetical protein BC827DRAFT_1235734 [Russula dissimulans]|nr:hypothetical protein BC827DRAFT_1235734 [Russula dissimulans]
MSVGRSSAFNLAPTVAVLLLSSFLPAVRADCWIDENTGVESCDGLSNAARIGIGAAIFLAFLFVLTSLVYYRRRRAAQANMIYAQHAQQGGGGDFYHRGHPPQYPPQAYNGVGYDPSTGFAPVRF